MFNNVSITCPCCESCFSFPFHGFVTDTEVDEDRQMGAETEYVIECEEFQCPNCSKTLSVFGSIWEYPVGAFNDMDLEVSAVSNDDEEDDE